MPLRAHHGVLPDVHPSAFIAESAYLIGDVRIGRDASVWFNAVLRGDINAVYVGERTNIQDGAVIHVTHEYPAVVGSDVTVGHQAMIHACTIEDFSLIGMSAVVLDRARVGPFAIVAAGSVVLERFIVPEGALVAGVPARVIRQVSDEERARLRESAAHYVQYAQSFLAAHQWEQRS